MGRVRSRRSPTGHHQGVVFTPDSLARRVAAPWSEPRSRGGPRLVDPACGDGALLLAALELRGGGPREARGLFGIEIDPDLCARARERLATAAGLAPGELADQIRCGDALDPAHPWPEETAVLANPPWASFSGRHAASPPETALPVRPGGWPSLHGAFLVRIAEHLAATGLGARLLLPASMLEQEGYRPVWAAAAAHAHQVGEALELGESAFPDVIEPAVLVELAPGPGVVPTSRPTSDPLLRHLARFPRFAPETFGDPGVHTGNCARELVLDAPAAGTAPLRRGADLAPFALGPARLHLRLDLERQDGRRFRIGPAERYTGVPVLLRQTADRPIAALHREPTYFRNSLLAARPPEGLAAEFLVALLNGSVARDWHRLSFRDARQRSFPQVKVGHLRTQPTPILKREEDPELHDEVVARVRALDPRAAGAEREALDARLRAAFGLA